MLFEFKSVGQIDDSADSTLPLAISTLVSSSATSTANVAVSSAAVITSSGSTSLQVSYLGPHGSLAIAEAPRSSEIGLRGDKTDAVNRDVLYGAGGNELWHDRRLRWYRRDLAPPRMAVLG